VKWLTPVWVTVAFPVPPLLRMTSQVKVAPTAAWTFLGHFALVILTAVVERLSSMPFSTCVWSTVPLEAAVVVAAVDGWLLVLLPQAVARRQLAQALKLARREQHAHAVARSWRTAPSRCSRICSEERKSSRCSGAICSA
jgi:hypothetical protein